MRVPKQHTVRELCRGPAAEWPRLRESAQQPASWRETARTLLYKQEGLPLRLKKKGAGGRRAGADIVRDVHSIRDRHWEHESHPPHPSLTIFSVYPFPSVRYRVR